MRRRPGETPQAAGRRFEQFWAKLFGKEPHKGSGNQWYLKLDVGDGSITWSLKLTSHRSLTISKEMLRECERGVYANGDNSIPGIAAAIDGGEDVIVVLKASDFVRLLSTDSARYITPSRGEQKRARARIPNLMRDDDG